MQELVPILCIFGLSTMFALAAILTGYLVCPRTKNEKKESPYECGMLQMNTDDIVYNPHFLIFAILFLLFDIETILLFPFAVAFSSLGLFAFCEAAVFVIILLFGLIYAVKKKMIRWR